VVNTVRQIISPLFHCYSRPCCAVRVHNSLWKKELCGSDLYVKYLRKLCFTFNVHGLSAGFISVHWPRTHATLSFVHLEYCSFQPQPSPVAASLRRWDPKLGVGLSMPVQRIASLISDCPLEDTGVSKMR
jgi:hypothetical protein